MFYLDVKKKTKGVCWSKFYLIVGRRPKTKGSVGRNRYIFGLKQKGGGRGYHTEKRVYKAHLTLLRWHSSLKIKIHEEEFIFGYVVVLDPIYIIVIY